MEKHDLHNEFPQFEEKIHSLKVSDNHFKKLFDEYHEANKDVHRIESGAETSTDEVLTQFRLTRLHLKDQLYAILNGN
jgi:uncharacterized protein YdcH (DUF465 family)